MKQFMILCAIAPVAMAMLGCSKGELDPKKPGNLVPKTAELDASIPQIAVNGTLLHAETFGNPTDPMVVFLHGGPGSDYRNGLNAKDLANHEYFVVFYDQRGSGLSKRHPKNSFDLDVMLEDLRSVINHYRNSPSQKVYLLGHSWGAMLTAAYINKYPDAVNGAVLAEPGGLNKAAFDEYSKKSRKLKLFDEVTNDVLYPDQFLTGNENDHAILDYKLALASQYTFAPGNAEGVEGPSPFWRNGAAMLKKLMEIAEKDGFDFTTNLHRFTTKVLFLYSENNTTYGETFARKEAAYFPNAQVSKVAGTGHEMFYFKWDNVKSWVLPYLDSLR